MPSGAGKVLLTEPRAGGRILAPGGRRGDVAELVDALS
jgi:hypothetical protein